MTKFDKAIKKYIENIDSETPRFSLICYICEDCRGCPIAEDCKGRSKDEIEKILMEECDEL